MSFDERSKWASGLISLGTFAAYVVIILRRADGGPLVDLAYRSTLLWTIVASVVLIVVAHVLIAVANPSEADKRDERDRAIERLGEYRGGLVLAVGMLGPFALSLWGADHFWISNAIYLVFVVGSTASSAFKVAAYRKGF